MKEIRIPVPGHPEAELEGYLLDCEITLGQDTSRPAVLVCPGGGYVYCSPREGEPVALSYAARGFHAFVLRYSTGKDAAGFAPLEEVSWAVGCLRENSAQWHLDPEKIALCGFSAGGHLALACGLLAQNRPNALILGYPAASAPNLPGLDFMLKVLEGRQEVTDADSEKYDLVSKIHKDAPPVFLVATAQDFLTAYGALPIANAYSRLGMVYELHIFQHGGHGLALGNEVTANGSVQRLQPSFAQWQELSVQWLHRIFGQLTFSTERKSGMMEILGQMGQGDGLSKLPGF